MPVPRLFDHPSQMEPLLPEDPEGRLAAMALSLIRRAEHLSGQLHPITRKTVADLVRAMNSYYSNLIEGHRTTPQDMEAALRRDFSSNAAQRALQMQHLAHLETQAEIETRLSAMPPGDICSSEFLCWIHREFYEALPASLRQVAGERAKVYAVAPGRLRQDEVTVGRHLAPASRRLEAFLTRFAGFYGAMVNTQPASLVAAAAAHHRLTWIHPFLDGNGRVSRLFTHAWLVQAGVGSGGLWTLSRGLARAQVEYRATLANADEKRINDYDGRGYLSQRHLFAFCQFFLQTALDQVDFMRELLDLDRMHERIAAYTAPRESLRELPRGAGRVLGSIFLRGELARGEVSRLAGTSPRTGQKLTGELLARRLVLSDSPKGPLRLAFPAEAAAWYFPSLYPAGAEESRPQA